MSKSVKAVIISAAVLLVLGGALAVLLITKPKTEPLAVDSVTESSGVNAYVCDRKVETVTSVKVENAEGAFTFTRQKRTVTETNESGEVVSTDEYYWTSEELKDVPQSDSSVKNFISNLASLPEKSLVEENAEDIKKYGLDNPQSTALLKFDDGTEIKMQFGIKNPADESSVYFRADNENTVHLVNYYAVAGTFSDVKQFANLVLTEQRESDAKNELEYLKVTRSDMDKPIELEYMSKKAELAESDSDAVTTFNTHRLVEPITAEVDVTKGKDVCYGVYGLSMSSCEYLEQTDDNLKKCGLDKPFTTVEFRYGGKEYELLIGNEIREEISDTGSTPMSAVKGYYAIMKGVAGIYTIDKDKVPWCTVKAADIVSPRPLSPYIYSVESVEVRVPEGKYKFDIDSENKTFSCDGKKLLSEEFKSFYQLLIGAVGEEFYTGNVSGEPIAEVTFNYKSDYVDAYGTESDTLSYYESDDRKCIVALNGTPIFKVRKVYTDRLSENVNAVLNGGKVNTEW